MKVRNLVTGKVEVEVEEEDDYIEIYKVDGTCSVYIECQIQRYIPEIYVRREDLNEFFEVVGKLREIMTR